MRKRRAISDQSHGADPSAAARAYNVGLGGKDNYGDQEIGHPLADRVEFELRRTVAQAMAMKDWTERQLSVLRNTYPNWDIERIRDLAGEVWWTARIRHEATPELVVAGVFPYVEQSDPIALAASLAWQTYLFHQWQARMTQPP